MIVSGGPHSARGKFGGSQNAFHAQTRTLEYMQTCLWLRLHELEYFIQNSFILVYTGLFTMVNVSQFKRYIQALLTGEMNEN